jgi:hypothetical protein
MINLDEAKLMLSKLLMFNANPYVSSEDIKKLADFVNGSDSDWTLFDLSRIRNMLNIYSDNLKKAEENGTGEDYKVLMRTLMKPYIGARNTLVDEVRVKANSVLEGITDFSNLYVLKRSISLNIPNFGNEHCFEFYKGDIVQTELGTVVKDKQQYVIPKNNAIKSILFKTAWSEIAFDKDDFVYFNKINGSNINVNDMFTVFEPLTSKNVNFDFLLD